MTTFTDDELARLANNPQHDISDLARELLQLRQQITPQAGEAFGYVYQKDYGNGIAELFFKKHKLTDFAGWEEIPLYCTAPPRPVCDGNHAAPACADPECWQRPSAVAPVWQPKCDLYRVGPYDTKRGGYPVLRGTDGASWGLFITRDDATDWARYRNCLIDIHGTDALPSPPDSPGAGDL